MKTILVVLFLAALPLVAHADEVTNRNERVLYVVTVSADRPSEKLKDTMARICAEQEHQAQLNLDKVVAATGVRPSELWVKGRLKAYFRPGGGRVSRHEYAGHRCVIELESRAEKLGLFSTITPRFFKEADCKADFENNAERPNLAFQHLIHDNTGIFNLGRDYCQVERIFVLPYDGRRGD